MNQDNSKLQTPYSKRSSRSAWRPSAAVIVAVGVWAFATPARALDEPLQSPRLERAKDLIADEQWERAIEQLKAAAADAKERNKDEALFWLAHSQHQSRDLAAAVQTISRLEREHPTSRWVKPARSLRVEIAQKLRREDVLWWTATPPPTMPTPAVIVSPRLSTPPSPPRPQAAPPLPPAGASPGGTPPTPPVPTPAPPAAARAPRGERPAMTYSLLNTPMPSTVWIPEGWDPDMNLRIQALGSLMKTDAARVIPILKEIALESPDANEASRAIFVLAQSGRPEAQSTVLEVAKNGSEIVQIAAVRELGRFGDRKVVEELMQVYTTVNPRVKYQVVHSLADRSATAALMRIAETEQDRTLKEMAIVRLGQTGARDQLVRFYTRSGSDLKRPIIVGLFNARAEDELIQIAESERDEKVRAEVLARLRLLGTAKARAYLEKERRNR